MLELKKEVSAKALTQRRAMITIVFIVERFKVRNIFKK